MRSRVAELAHWLGVRLDPGANAVNQTELHRPNSAVHILLIPTNEELMIAVHTRRALAEALD